MRYYQCKCGESKAFGSQGPPLCISCPKCGTNLYGTGPPEEHKWVKRYNEHSGEPYMLCIECMSRDKDISKI